MQTKHKQNFKFRGFFNYQGETHHLETYAITKAKATANLLWQLSEKLDLQYTILYQYFKGTDKYTVQRCLEDEVDNLVLTVHRMNREQLDRVAEDVTNCNMVENIITH